MDSRVWGGPRVLPHEVDDLRAPDERVRHGEASEGEGSKEAESLKEKGEAT